MIVHGGNVWQGGGPEKWLDYSANIRPEGAPQWVKDALAGAMEDLAYYPDPQMKRAKHALSQYLSLPEEFVLPTAGGISAIDLAAHLPASVVHQFTPCFAEYAMLSENLGKTIINIPLLTGLHKIGDPARQAEPLLADGSIVFLCNPLNPVGCAFSRGQIERLLYLVEEKRGWLVVDEAFIDYCPEHSAAGLILEHERLLITGSMTKILGIPGVRLGYLCAHPDTLALISKYQLTWEVSCFAEAVLCALPEHKADVLKYGEINAQRRNHLENKIDELGFYVYPSEAAFILADCNMPADKLIEKLKAKGVLVRQCMNFEGLDDGRHIRLAVKDEKSNDRLADSIKEVIECAENR